MPLTELMQKAEEGDPSARDDGQKLPEGLAHREALREKVAEARHWIEARAEIPADAERGDFERKVKEREQRPYASTGAPSRTPLMAAETCLRLKGLCTNG